MNKPFKIIGIVFGVTACGVAIIIAIGALWVLAEKDLPISENDKKMIVRAIDLVPYFDEYSPSEEYESFSKTRYIDQSEELNYEYSSSVEDEPYISMTVSYEKKMSDAKLVFRLEWSAQNLGFNIADGKYDFKEIDSFYSSGDQSRFANITYDGNPIGHLLVIRKKKTVYAYTIAGFLMEDPTIWQELFDKRIVDLE